MYGTVAAVLPWGRLGAGTTVGVVFWGGVPRPQTNLALRPKQGPAQAGAEVHHVIIVGPQRVESEVTARRSLAAPEPLQPYTLWVASNYHMRLPG